MKSDLPFHLRAFRWAKRVVAKEEIAPRLVQLACKRFLNDLKSFPFDPKKVDRVCRFMELLPLLKGPLAGQKLHLLDWEIFVLANLFGFSENGVRRFRQAQIWIPRGNGKTQFLACIALYLSFVDGEGGAEGYCAAVNREQAKLLWKTAHSIVTKSLSFRKRFGVQPKAQTIWQPATQSSLMAVSRDARSLEGFNTHFCALDELGSHKTPEVYDVFLTSMAKRLQPMMCSISTATSFLEGIGKLQFDYGKQIVEGIIEDESMFVLIYQADEDEDIYDKKVWRKVNPSWGVAVDPVGFTAIAKQSQQSPAREAAFKTKHLNIWVSSDQQLFTAEQWKRSILEEVPDITGRPAWLGVDLATKTDLAAITLLVDLQDGRYWAKTFPYLNQLAIQDKRNAYYPEWAKKKFIKVTPGNVTDINVIEEDVMALSKVVHLLGVGYDPWAATQFAQNLIAAGIPAMEVQQNVKNLSEPTKLLEEWLLKGKFVHHGNPVFSWCMSNVVGHYDAKSNVFPKRPNNVHKIDCALALIMAIAIAIFGEKPKISVYDTEKRGILAI